MPCIQLEPTVILEWVLNQLPNVLNCSGSVWPSAVASSWVTLQWLLRSSLNPSDCHIWDISDQHWSRSQLDHSHDLLSMRFTFIDFSVREYQPKIRDSTSQVNWCSFIQSLQILPFFHLLRFNLFLNF